MKTARRTFLKQTGLVLAGAAAATLDGPAQANQADPLAALTPLPGEIDPIGPADFARRHERARELMHKQGWGALFLSGSNNLYYFSGVNMGATDRLFAMLLPAKGEPAVVCPAFEAERAKERIKCGQNRFLLWEEDEDPFKLAAGILRDLGLASGTVGIDGNLPYWYYDHLSKSLPTAKYRNADAVTQELRLIKEPKEIALTRRAVAITMKAYAAAFATVQKGMKQAELAQAISRAFSRLGAPGGAMVSIGQASGLPHGSRREYYIEEGSVVLVDGGCRVDNYPSDITRTIVVGQSPDKVVKVWETVHRAQAAAIAAVRPGVPCEEIDRVARRVMEEAGWGSGYKYFAHRLGHGLGLDGHDGSCHLVRGNRTPLRPNMIFTIEPGLYLPGEFGVRLEDNIVVTETGGEVLGNQLAISIDRQFG